MTGEELLKPRYEVIADYPGSPFMIGQIYNTRMGNSCKRVIDLDNSVTIVDEYPHLFKELKWWEKRTEAEMPKYVKFVYNGSIRYVHEVVEWKGHNYNGQPLYSYYNKVGTLMSACAWETEPATEQEYRECAKNK